MSDNHSPTSETYDPAVWRVILHQKASGAMNMAIDEAIAAHVGTQLAPPTLRFYQWKPACLSLGYGQPSTDVDLERLRDKGWDIVRRLSGGRAILHIDELTYSIAIPADDPRMQGGVIDSYRRLSRGLIGGLEALDISVNANPATRQVHRFKGPVCFEVPSDYEITVRGKKLIGSAQTRRSGLAALQHGTLPLFGDIARICETLAFPSEWHRQVAVARVRERALTLEDILGKQVDFRIAARAIQQGFEQALNLTLVVSELSKEERSQAENLRINKYATDAWTHRS